MSSLAVATLAMHYALVALLCIYGAHRIFLTYIAWQTPAVKLTDVKHGLDKTEPNLPHVTIQAPLYNEKFVVKRLIDSLASIEYPLDRLQIQIVDDSTDESIEIAATHIAHHRENGVDISHVRRTNRTGFKAGALQNAMQTAKGDLIAIFDADFIPEPDFLMKVVPFMMKNSHIGMAQTRWKHLNADANTLTRVQSIILDAHFAIEQVARHATGAYFNFNGTAGVWRKETIIDAGGWCADTLTEDLDLSYRAQMKGWRFAYLRDVGCPSELPADMQAFKTQQHRWAKGAIEVMKKLLVSVWKSRAPRHIKMEATFHLTSNVSYMLMLVDSLFFLLPSIYIREKMGWNLLTWFDLPLFFFASASHAVFFVSSQKLLYGKAFEKTALLPALLATSIGLSVNNGRAVLEAALGHVTGFVRTPKTGGISNAPYNRLTLPNFSNSYKTMGALWADYLELFLASLYIAYLTWAILNGYWIVTPFLALFAVGFLLTGISSLCARKGFNKRAHLRVRAQQS